MVKGDSDISSVSDLKGKTVAAKKGTISTAYAERIAEEYGFTIEYYEDSPAIKKGKHPELIEMFNRGLENIKASGEYDRILAKYGYDK